MAILASFTCFAPGSPVDQVLAPLAAFVPGSTSPVITMPAVVGRVLAVLLWGYLVLLPFAHGGLWINLYGRKALPKPRQRQAARGAAGSD